MIFVDVSHWNPEDAAHRPDRRDMNWTAAVAAGLCGAVIKYTQGRSGTDPAAFLHAYKAWQAKVPLLGAYHFGDGGSSGVVQARHFLDFVSQDWGGDFSSVMLMLDAERNSPQMSVGQAEDFVQTVHDVVGRWPWIYMGRDGPDGAGTGLPSSILSNCQLLVAAYGPHDKDLGRMMPRGFSMPTDSGFRPAVCRGWQFTDGTIHGGPFPGLGRVDQSKFIGITSLDEARAIWTT